MGERQALVEEVECPRCKRKHATTTEIVTHYLWDVCEKCLTLEERTEQKKAIDNFFKVNYAKWLKN